MARMPWEYGACKNRACWRKVGGAAYCCAPCSAADQDHWDVSGQHSSGCDQRAAERGEWTRDTRPWS